MPSRLQTKLGFARHAHLRRWLLSGGTLIIFSLFSLRLLFFDSVLCGRGHGGALPGECYYFRSSRVARLGITAHLWCILPAAVLAAVQFVPAVHRPPLLRLHRAIGYTSIALGFAGSVAALPIIRHSFGGDPASQVATGLLFVAFVVAQVAGYVSIRRRDVYHHRHWMLRSWFYAGSIISMRIIMALTALAISLITGYCLAMPCAKINSILGSRQETLRWYPECSPFFTGDVSRKAVVDADVFAPNAVPLAAAFNLAYGMSAWVGLCSHIVGVEIYIQSQSPKKSVAVESDMKSK